MKIRTVFYSLLVCFFAAQASAAENMRIAILDLQPTGVARTTAKAVSDMIRADMIDMNIFTVVERSQMTAILNEQGFQQTGCTDSSCAVELGKLVSARKILIGEISKLGAGMLITVRVVDVEKGVAEYAASEKSTGEKDIDEAARRLSLKLAERITGLRGAEILERQARLTKHGYYLRGIVPGWGQFYAGHWIHGTVISTAFTGTSVWAAVALVNFSKSKKDYDDLATGLPQSTYNEAYDKKKKDYRIAMASLITVGCVYAINWIDLIFFTKPQFSEPMALLKYENIHADMGIVHESLTDDPSALNTGETRMCISLNLYF